MKLDKHVVDMFTELTKPADDVKMEKTCYGTISVVDGTRYVKLDGSDLLVPAASTVKTSHGDRVTVLMKNHSLTVTGNLTAPATDGEGGSSGEAGTAATIEIGTVTTGEAGSSASVTNSGTTSAAVFDFVIPRGDKGDKGDTGPQGPRGEKGDAGEPGHKLFVGTDFNSTSAGEIHSNLDFTETASIGDWYLNNQLGSLYQCVTAGTEGNSWWHYIATISAKANGGNADTVDGLHAQKFMQYLGCLTSGSLLDKVLALNTSGFVYCTGDVTDTPETGQHFFVDIKNSGGTISLQATRFNNGTTYTNRYNTSSKKWYGWTNVADGGNADTVDGLHANEIASNPNLLINHDFAINQRGERSYVVTGYTVDRWQSQKKFTITPLGNGNGIRIEPVESISTNLLALCQDVPITKAMRGKCFTLSTNIETTNEYAAMAIYAYNSENSVVKTSSKIQLQVGFNAVTIQNIPDTTSYIRCQFTINSGANTGDILDILWAKFETGSISTPYCFPDPAIELLKCQRYFIRLDYGSYRASGSALSSTTAYLSIPLPIAMPKDPTLTVNGSTPTFNTHSSRSNQVTTLVATTRSNNGILIQVSGNFTTCELVSAYHAKVDGLAYPLLISAEN